MALFLGPVLARALPTNITWKAELTVKETYDDNVYILDTRADPSIVPPPNSIIAVPHKESFVTTVTPYVGLTYRACPAFAASVSYAPDAVWYHSAPSEDYFAHRGAVNFNGKIQNASYEWLNNVVWIDGNHLGVTTLRPGDCRAIGGIPLRDRRDQAVYRDGFKLALPFGKWFVRPVVSTYVHDFQITQRANLPQNRTNFVYDNYIDRWEVNGGLDAGYEGFKGTKFVVGYRFGHQEQGELLGVESRFSNDYQRFLAGVEGSPWKWLKVSILAGPDVRNWQHNMPAGFNRDELLWYVDGTVAVLPTDADTVALKLTRFEQPAFTSQSVYEDIKYDLSWRHKFTEKFTVGIGFILYIGDWQAPMHREDWIYTPSAMASYAFTKHVIAELNYFHDSAVNQVSTSAPGATYANGREYTRNLVSLAVKYTF